MSISSADPSNLQVFTDGGPVPRTSLADAQRVASTTSAGVVARCVYRSVSSTHLASLASLLEHMGANEGFVSTVCTELLAADVLGAGPVAVSDGALRAALDGNGYDQRPPDITIAESSLFGLPPTSGFVDDPICAANGNFVQVDHDLIFPASSSVLNVGRVYNSLRGGVVGAFGAGWSSVLDVALDASLSADGVVTVALADGAVVPFRADESSGRWVTGRRQLALSRDADQWVLCEGAGTLRRWSRFDADGVLVGWTVGIVPDADGSSAVTVGRDGHGRVIGLSERRSQRSVAVFWANGRVESLRADDGRSVSYEYDDVARLVAAVSASGSFRYEYDAGLLHAAFDLDGVTQFVNVYDEFGRVAAQTSPFGRVTSYRYDPSGMTVISDQHGVRQAMVHDRYGNVTTVVDTDGSAMRLTYDDAHHVVRAVSKLGDEWAYEYDDSGVMVRRIDPDGLSQSWEFDELGRLLCDIDRSGAVTRHEYSGTHATPERVIGPVGEATAELDDSGRAVRVTDPDGVVTRYEWDRDGQLAASIDALGAVTRFEYDVAGRVVRVVAPDGVEGRVDHDAAGRAVRTVHGEAETSFERTPAGRIAAGSHPGGVSWRAEFGVHGLPVSVVDAMGATVGFDYDTSGNVTSVTTPDGAVYRNEYDDVGRIVVMIDAAGATSRLGYDRDGRAITATDALGAVATRTVDSFGRTLTSTSADGAMTARTYHPCGEIATVTLPDGRMWSSEVDVAGRVVAVVDPAGRRSSRAYSPAGRLISRTGPAGQIERFEYDAAGRRIAAVDSFGLRREVMRDACGRVVRELAETPDGIRRHADTVWDAQGHVAAHGVDGAWRRIERDGAGRVTRDIDASGVAVGYEWDQRGLLTGATDPTGVTSTYDYDLRGRLVAQTMPGDRTTTWGYDPSGRVASMIDPAGVVTRFDRNANGAVVAERRGSIGWARTLDALGREVARTGTDGTEHRYRYDQCGRVIAAEVVGGAVVGGGLTGDGASGWLTEFLWDGSDTVIAISDPQGTVSFERPAADPTTTARTPGSVRPTQHDRAGRLAAGRDGTVYRYDRAGRLVEIVPKVGAATAFEYAPDGLVAVERGPHGVRRFDYDAAGRVAAVMVDGAGTTEITYDASGRRSAERGPDGETTYVWDAFDRLTRIDRTTPHRDRSSVAIAYDALGRPARIGDDPNDVGPTLSSLGDPAGVAVGSVRVLGARVYDPATHQFLSADPWLTVPGTNGSASAYTYAWQDPVNFVDPSGLQAISQEAFDAIRSREEQGRVGQMVEAIAAEPWQALGAAGMFVLGAALVATGVGAPIGAGLMIGVGTSFAVGFATGNVDPTNMLVSGLVGAGTGGAMSWASGTGSIAAVLGTGGAAGAGSDLAAQLASGQPIDLGSAFASGLVGVGTAGIGSRLPAGLSTTRQVAIGAVTDGGADIAYQALTGDGHVNLGATFFSAVTGGATTNLATRFAPAAAPTLPHGFESATEFRAFGSDLRAGLGAAGYNDVTPILQGSSATGVSYRTGQPFDQDRVSDFDVALASSTMLHRAAASGVQLRSGGTRTGPLRARDLEQLGIGDLAADLSVSSGRPVNFMIYGNVEDAAARSPSVLVPEP